MQEIIGERPLVSNANKIKAWLIWAFLFILPLYFYPRVFHSSWLSSSDVHGPLEFWAASIALTLACVILVHFFATGRWLFLLISLGFTLQGAEDLVHAVYSYGRLWGADQATIAGFVPATYFAGRLALVTCIFLALVFDKSLPGIKTGKRVKVALVYSTFGFITAVLLTWLFIQHPFTSAHFIIPGRFISRPFDLVMALAYLAIFFIFARLYDTEEYNNPFIRGMIVSIIFGFAAEFYMIRSQSLYDGLFDAAHIFKILSYIFPIIGVAFGTYYMYLKEQALSGRLAATVENEASVIRELKDTQEQLLQSGKMAAVGQMASGIAHELKNPLNIVVQGVEHIKRKMKPDSGVNPEALQMIIDASLRASRTITGILNFSRKAELRLEPVDMSEVIRAAIFLVEQGGALRGITLEQDISSDLPSVMADRNLLEQVFVNILMNAIKSMPGSGRLNIKVRATGKDELGNYPGIKGQDLSKLGDKALLCEVRDTGCGMSEEVLSRVFDPFFTTRDVGEGVGIGLPIARSIVHGHKGLIGLMSKEGEGTTAFVILPVGKD